MRKEETVIVFGAGADCGIFPMTNHLVAAINRFLREDEAGIAADKMLKKALGLKRYGYSSIMDEVAFKFVGRTNSGQIEGIDKRIRSLSPTPDEKPLCDFILALTDTIRRYSKKARDIEKMEDHPELVKMLKDAGLEKIVTVCPGTTVTSFLLKSFRALLHVYLDMPDNKALHQLFKVMVRFDSILLELFLGFYNGNRTDIRRYMYVSWTMWAFFVHTEQQFLLKNDENLCIYSKMKEYSAITLNYTTLADRFMGQKGSVLHFHGSSVKYIDCGTREELTLPSFSGGNFIEENPPMLEVLKNDVIPRLHPDWNHSVIPSMIPPFEIKPVIASDTIETWHRALEVLDACRRIFVIGYSFNHVDMHFNDNIIKWLGDGEKELFIINPDIKSIVAYFDSCPRMAPYSGGWKEVKVCGTDISCLKKANVVLIPGTTRNIMSDGDGHIRIDCIGL